jgi:hypothetical protein
MRIYWLLLTLLLHHSVGFSLGSGELEAAEVEEASVGSPQVVSPSPASAEATVPAKAPVPVAVPAPAAEPAPAEGKVVDQTTDEKGAEGAVPVVEKVAKDETPKVRSDLSLSLDDNLKIASGFGYTSVKVKGANWRAGGYSFLEAAWRQEFKLVAAPVWGLFRFSTIDVAPIIKSADSRQQYVGVVEFYSVGGKASWVLGSDFNLASGVSLGLARTLVKEVSRVTSKTPPKKYGVMAEIDVDFQYNLAKKFQVLSGLNLKLGRVMAPAAVLGAAWVW